MSRLGDLILLERTRPVSYTHLVAFAKCIDHEYQKFGLAHLSTSFTIDNALKLRETIGYALFPP